MSPIKHSKPNYKQLTSRRLKQKSSILQRARQAKESASLEAQALRLMVREAPAVDCHYVFSLGTNLLLVLGRYG